MRDGYSRLEKAPKIVLEGELLALLLWRSSKWKDLMYEMLGLSLCNAT